MSGHRQIIRTSLGPAAEFSLFVKVAGEGWTWLMQCRARAAERRDLAQLPDWQLRDLGITRAQADAEAAKWFWRL